jgi:hypothetical protein
VPARRAPSRKRATRDTPGSMPPTSSAAAL